MKTIHFAAFAIATTLLWTPHTASAQTVTTGLIETIIPEAGVMFIRSDQTHRHVRVTGLGRAYIFTADGMPLVADDLEAGHRVTLEYVHRGNQWYIDKILLSEPRPTIRGSLSRSSVERIRERTEGTERTPSAPGEAPETIEVAPLSTGGTIPPPHTNP